MSKYVQPCYDGFCVSYSPRNENMYMTFLPNKYFRDKNKIKKTMTLRCVSVA